MLVADVPYVDLDEVRIRLGHSIATCLITRQLHVPAQAYAHTKSSDKLWGEGRGGAGEKCYLLPRRLLVLIKLCNLLNSENLFIARILFSIYLLIISSILMFIAIWYRASVVYMGRRGVSGAGRESIKLQFGGSRSLNSSNVYY